MIKYYKNLDGLRGMAVLMVMFGHFFMPLHSSVRLLETVLTKISILGQLGVSLFFVLSGFLISRILLDTKEQIGYFKNFYIRRILRIFPLYYFFLLIFYYVLPLLFKREYSNFGEQIPYFVYLQNFVQTFHWKGTGPSHFWSLSVEEHFYLFWPLIIFIFNEKQIGRVVFLLIGISILLRYIFLTHNTEVYYFTFTRMDSLAIGSLLSIVEKRNLSNSFRPRNYMLVFTALLIPAFVIWLFGVAKSDEFLQIFKYTFFSVIFFALIGILIGINDKHPINRIFKSNFLIFTGKISYGLYVYHIFAFELMTHYMKSGYWFLNFAIFFVMAYLISWLSFRFFETKFLKLKKYFTPPASSDK